MAERWMAEIVRQPDRFNKIRINVEIRTKSFAGLVQVLSYGASNPGDLNGMCQAGAVEIIFSGLEYLRL